MKISIVTPSYNQGTFIERTIRSVLEQDVEEMEYWVIDGGSQDSTIDILKRSESHLNWLSEKDTGQANAVNKGIQRSQGEVIGWLNSDDVYLAGALQRVLEVFSSRPEVDVVYGNAVHIGEDDRVLDAYPVEAWDSERLQETCFICQPATFFRRRVVELAGLLDEDLQFCLDYEYWLRLAQRGVTFRHIPFVLAGSRMYPENKTMKHRLRLHGEINDMLHGCLGTVPDRWIFNYAHAWSDRLCSRDRRVLFTIVVSLVSWWASLWWNGRFTPGVRRRTSKWLRSNIRSQRHASR